MTSGGGLHPRPGTMHDQPTLRYWAALYRVRCESQCHTTAPNLVR